jgi:hypothetical protein
VILEELPELICEIDAAGNVVRVIGDQSPG